MRAWVKKDEFARPYFVVHYSGEDYWRFFADFKEFGNHLWMDVTAWGMNGIERGLLSGGDSHSREAQKALDKMVDLAENNPWFKSARVALLGGQITLKKIPMASLPDVVNLEMRVHTMSEWVPSAQYAQMRLIDGRLLLVEEGVGAGKTPL